MLLYRVSHHNCWQSEFEPLLREVSKEDGEVGADTSTNRGVRYAKFWSIQYFLDINIYQNCRCIGLSICLIDIENTPKHQGQRRRGRSWRGGCRRGRCHRGGCQAGLCRWCWKAGGSSEGLFHLCSSPWWKCWSSVERGSSRWPWLLSMPPELH